MAERIVRRKLDLAFTENQETALVLKASAADLSLEQYVSQIIVAELDKTQPSKYKLGDAPKNGESELIKFECAEENRKSYVATLQEVVRVARANPDLLEMLRSQLDAIHKRLHNRGDC